MRYCLPAGREAGLIEGGGDAPHVLMQAALGQQCARQQRRRDPPERQPREAALEQECDSADGRDQDQDRNRSRHPPCRRRRRVVVQAAIQCADQGAHPGYRMADAAQQPVRVAERDLEQESQKGECGGHRVSQECNAE
jgi:hypothetical protein